MLSYNKKRNVWEYYERDCHMVITERTDKGLIDIAMFFEKLESYYDVEIATASPMTAKQMEKLSDGADSLVEEREIKNIYKVVTTAFPASGYVTVFKRKGMGKSGIVLECMGRKGMESFHYTNEECNRDICPKPIIEHPGSWT